jgi:hypothetical protein
MPIETYTKTGQDVATDVQNKFGDTGQVQVTDAMLLSWINSGQQEIATNDIRLTGTSVTNLLAGVAIYDLGSVSASIRSIIQVRVNGAYAEVLQYPQFSQFVRDNTDTGATASIATLWNGALQIWPAPAASVVQGLIIDYTAYPASLSGLNAPLTVPDRFYQALCDWVLAQALELDENYEAAQSKLGHYENRVTKQLSRTNESPTDYYHVVEPTAEWI